jgi:hypothetical protein
MTEKQPEPQPLIAEVLIATASKMAQEQGVKLVELMGHMEIAKLEVFNRNVKAAQQVAENQPFEPAEGDDKVTKMDAAPTLSGGKA